MSTAISPEPVDAWTAFFLACLEGAETVRRRREAKEHTVLCIPTEKAVSHRDFPNATSATTPFRHYAVELHPKGHENVQ